MLETGLTIVDTTYSNLKLALILVTGAEKMLRYALHDGLFIKIPIALNPKKPAWVTRRASKAVATGEDYASASTSFTRAAASFSSVADFTFRPLSSMMRAPSSALVPCRRTMMGTRMSPIFL